MILLGALFTLLFFIFIFFSVSLLISLRKLCPQKSYRLPEAVPTVSICIPARNEMHALSECLERVLASTYPKLEVLVLDDASQDDTPIIIKSFAHAGVRFIPGEPLPEGWLGRNYAREILAREASGAYVIFMDVDTFLQPNTISDLVSYAVAEKKEMVSVIPRRNDTYHASTLFGTLRYFWQLVLRLRVPASSSLWLIKRSTLFDTLGGFVRAKGQVEPEAEIAARLRDNYQALLGNGALGVSYEKRWKSQLATSRRLLFPFFGKNFWGGLGGFVLLGLLNLPAGLLLYGITDWSLWQNVALIAVVVYGCLYAFYLRFTWRNRWWLGVILWPYAIFQELIVYCVSVWGYIFKSITWKNRSIHTVASKK